MGKSKVAVISATPETVFADIVKLCQLAGLGDALGSDTGTIVKDVVSRRQPFPSANTTPWQFEGAVLALKHHGFEKLSLVQNEPQLSNAHKSHRTTQYTPLCEKYDIPVLYNFKARDMKWIEYRPKATLRALQHAFPGGVLLPDYFFGKNVVHLPTLKCHVHSVTSGAMHSAVGGLLDAKHYYASSWIHHVLVDVLALQREIHNGVFAIMDGTTAGNGPGPGRLVPVTKSVLLASKDQVAVDAVAAKLMGFDPMGIDYIRLAHEAGLGVGDPRDIELEGANISQESWGFSPGNSSVAAQMPKRTARSHALSKLAHHTKLVQLAARGELYYEQYRWRRKDQATFEQWKRTSPWGQLFEAYALGQSDRIVGRPRDE